MLRIMQIILMYYDGYKYANYGWSNNSEVGEKNGKDKDHQK